MNIFAASQLPMSFKDSYEPTKGTMSHVKNFCLREKVFYGVNEKRVCRQIRFQTPISPSRDPSSDTGDNGEMKKL